ncbi:hypothetical protein ACFQ3J_08925 [Paenibacillus provencensis]|uniref:Uncharacterized protein n=1 Tax=Paenibacillus provencensis TaxID=441151 RepID=A0ABW3PXN0_9BACL|nr:hypothetical protein [Paenibacillus sp. MER 78]MCM3128986.1 hypothetical protein [Paenibacillus sp. MER 78]
MSKNIQLVESSVDEALYLFELMDKYGLYCSMELTLTSSRDTFVGVSHQPVKTEFIESKDGDSFVVALGEAEFCFELNLQISKQLTNRQLFMCVANDEYTAWFNSGALPEKFITEANSYRAPAPDENEPIFLEVNDREKNLIEYLRTLKFDDLLDATDAIRNGAKEAELKGYEQAYKQREAIIVSGWFDRSGKLEKLQELLGMANDDYCEHVYPELTGEEESL